MNCDGEEEEELTVDYSISQLQNMDEAELVPIVERALGAEVSSSLDKTGLLKSYLEKRTVAQLKAMVPEGLQLSATRKADIVDKLVCAASGGKSDEEGAAGGNPDEEGAAGKVLKNKEKGARHHIPTNMADRKKKRLTGEQKDSLAPANRDIGELFSHQYVIATSSLGSKTRICDRVQTAEKFWGQMSKEEKEEFQSSGAVPVAVTNAIAAEGAAVGATAAAIGAATVGAYSVGTAATANDASADNAAAVPNESGTQQDVEMVDDGTASTKTVTPKPNSRGKGKRGGGGTTGGSTAGDQPTKRLRRMSEDRPRRMSDKEKAEAFSMYGDTYNDLKKYLKDAGQGTSGHGDNQAMRAKLWKLGYVPHGMRKGAHM